MSERRGLACGVSVVLLLAGCGGDDGPRDGRWHDVTGADDGGEATCTPGPESCDGRDNDCDGETDEPDASGCRDYHPDADGDLFGDATSSRCLCGPLAPYILTEGSDCDDANAAVHPGVVEDCSNELDDDCSGRQECARLPAAPSAGEFMWQDVQTAFVDPDGGRCTGHITAAMGMNATCFADAADNLRCAGRINAREFGTSFVDATSALVDRVMIDGSASALCVLQTGGRLACTGEGNAYGQFGTGSTGTAMTFHDYLVPDPIAQTGVGTWESLCVMTDAGGVFCAGLGYAPSPVVQDGGHAHSSFAIDSANTLRLDPTDVWRAQSGNAHCSVQATGLVCDSGVVAGTSAGHVVMGGVHVRGTAYRTCWLHDDGLAFCAEAPALADPPTGAVAAFTVRPVLFLVLNFHIEGECAVYDDGSMACRGQNLEGMLGTGTTTPVPNEVTVAPPGSFDIRCP